MPKFRLYATPEWKRTWAKEKDKSEYGLFGFLLLFCCLVFWDAASRKFVYWITFRENARFPPTISCYFLTMVFEGALQVLPLCHIQGPSCFTSERRPGSRKPEKRCGHQTGDIKRPPFIISDRLFHMTSIPLYLWLQRIEEWWVSNKP